MTQRTNPWQSYRKIATQTAPPPQLVLMLYEGAISFLDKALRGFDYTDPLDFNLTINNNVLRAQAIIHELNSRLDMEQGGESAAIFRQLYSYFYRRLQEANTKKKKEPIVEVSRRLRVLRDSWAEMLQRGAGNDVVAASTTGSLSLQAA